MEQSRATHHVARSRVLRLRNRGLAAAGATTLAAAGVFASVAYAGTSTSPATVRKQLAPYVVKNKEEAGFHLAGKLQVVVTPAAFAKLTTSSDSGLAKAGFAGYVAQSTSSPAGLPGLSWVMRLGSPAGARSVAVAQMKGLGSATDGSKVTTFSVAGVPSAHGFSYSGGGAPGSASNVLFIEGSCVLLVGDGDASNGLPVKTTRAYAIAGVKAVFRRTAHAHGACAG